jgi:hypothetical protein
MAYFIIINIFASGALALVSRERRNASPHDDSIEGRHQGWKTHSWGTGYENGHGGRYQTQTLQTVTVTVTVTVDPASSNVTASAGNEITATPTEDLAPITLIDISTLTGISGTGSQDSVPTSSTADDLAPITLITLETAVPTSVATSVGNAAAPTPNDIAPITLITLGV